MQTFEALQLRHDPLGKPFAPAAAVNQQVVHELLDPIPLAPALGEAVRQVMVIAAQVLGMKSRRYPPQPEVGVAEQHLVVVLRWCAHRAPNGAVSHNGWLLGGLGRSALHGAKPAKNGVKHEFGFER